MKLIYNDYCNKKDKENNYDDTEGDKDDEEKDNCICNKEEEGTDKK